MWAENSKAMSFHIVRMVGVIESVRQMDAPSRQRYGDAGRTVIRIGHHISAIMTTHYNSAFVNYSAFR